MSFSVETYVACVRFVLTRRPLSVRRLIPMGTLLIAYPCLQVLVRIGMWLDWLFVPSIRRQSIESPLFIVGVPRSGTTFLQSLLCGDRARFCYMTLLDGLMPAVSFRWLLNLVARMDKFVLRGAGAWVIGKIEAAMVSDFDSIHALRLQQYEDDIWLCHLCLSGALTVVFGPIEELNVSIDDLHPVTQRKMLRWYESCMKRQLVAHNAKHLRFFSKNTTLLTGMHTFAEGFPDARFIYLVRNPVSNLSSLLSMAYSFWRIGYPEIQKDGPELRQARQRICDWHRRGLQAVNTLPPERLLVIRYDDLVADPRDAVTKIYDWLGLDIESEFDQVLDEIVSQHRSRRSMHRHTLEDFGLTENDVYDELREVFLRFDWPAPAESELKSSPQELT